MILVLLTANQSTTDVPASAGDPIEAEDPAPIVPAEVRDAELTVGAAQHRAREHDVFVPAELDRDQLLVVEQVLGNTQAVITLELDRPLVHQLAIDVELVVRDELHELDTAGQVRGRLDVLYDRPALED